ncbi:hypothetical protein DRO69_07275 [Candidatus Bathyarchaeota archaeon]|nr:MAG: hypothetical protein DRO69_07275 [Candidatus Bathyarchaeota archaeon]
MGYKILIVGCGAQGKAIADYLARLPEVDEIRVSDVNLNVCKNFVEWLKSDKVSAYKVDAGRVDEIASLAKDMDIVVNAVVPKFNLNILDAAFKAGTHYIDLAFEYADFERELERSDKFKEIDRTALTGAGFAPGLTNIISACAVDNLDEVESIFIRDATRRPFSTWSPETLIDDWLTEPTIFKNGEFAKVSLFSGEEIFEFPAPLGPQPVWYHAHEEPHMMGRFIGKGLKNVDFKMGGPDHIFIKQLWELGFLSDSPINVKSVEVVPRDVYLALVPKPPTLEELRDMAVRGILGKEEGSMIIRVIGKKDDVKVEHVYTIHSPTTLKLQEKWPICNSISYAVSSVSSLLVSFVCKGEIETRGVITPELLEPDVRGKLLAALAKQDPPIRVFERVEKFIA